MNAGDAAIEIKRLSRERGFLLVGIARAEKLPSAPLERWLAQGMHASMRWMESRVDERLDPTRYLRGARSVVAVAVSYAHPDSNPESTEPEIHSCRGTETVKRGPSARRAGGDSPVTGGDVAQRQRGAACGEQAPGSALFGALRRHRTSPLCDRALPAPPIGPAALPTCAASTEAAGPRSAGVGNGNCGFPAELNVARYARGRDYHNVILKRLRKLRVDCERAVGGHWRTSVDTAPVMEKAWAERAGLGWIGKNGCLIHPECGSLLLLGTLITDVELAADKPGVNRCGSCRLCIDACPTAAIVEPGVVDARRCLSFHTIESRAAIPLPIARAAEGRVFGCDTCQDVCPWNRSPEGDPDAALAPRPAQSALNVEDVLALDAESFTARYIGTPLMRAGRNGLVRAALAVAARPLSEKARVLAEQLAENDPSEVIRAHAREALGA